MSTVGIFALLIALGVVGYVLWLIFGTKPTAASDALVLLAGSMSGKTTQTPATDVPRSFNQEQGATFSYSGWILVNDYTFNYGEKRLIFTKGDCPGLYLDTTSNGLLVVVDTYGTKETIHISNIPAKKWIHFAIVVDQDALKIYINGVIRQHHSLGQLPKQNTEAVIVGSVTKGWDGTLAKLEYTPRSLSADEVAALTSQVPHDSQSPPFPQYFDMTWYTGRV